MSSILFSEVSLQENHYREYSTVKHIENGYVSMNREMKVDG